MRLQRMQSPWASVSVMMGVEATPHAILTVGAATVKAVEGCTLLLSVGDSKGMYLHLCTLLALPRLNVSLHHFYQGARCGWQLWLSSLSLIVLARALPATSQQRLHAEVTHHHPRIFVAELPEIFNLRVLTDYDVKR